MNGLRMTAFALAGCVCATTVWANGASITRTAGSNLAAPPSAPIEVFFTPGTTGSAGGWSLGVDLIHIPSAGPMIKQFMSPPSSFVPSQPVLFPINEDFFIIVPQVTAGPGAPIYPVLDWHEEILTPGWEWVIPGDPIPPGAVSPFDPGESLITKNGDPHPWTAIPHPGGPDPTKIWVEFPPIFPREKLDVHKALLWVGAPGNTTWGDGQDDAGNDLDERYIEVLEYPTPEPGALALLGIGALAVTRRR